MDFGIAVDLRGGGLESAGTGALCEAEGVDGTEHGCFGRLDRVVLVMGRRGGAGEVVDAVHLEAERLGHIVADEFEIGVGKQVGDVALPSGEIVVEADDLIAFVEQAFAEMGAEEAGSSGDEDSHTAVLTFNPQLSTFNSESFAALDRGKAAAAWFRA